MSQQARTQLMNMHTMLPRGTGDQRQACHECIQMPHCTQLWFSSQQETKCLCPTDVDAQGSEQRRMQTSARPATSAYRCRTARHPLLSCQLSGLPA